MAFPGMVGSIAGGILIKRLSLQLLDIAKLQVVCKFVGLILIAVAMNMACPEIDMFGKILYQRCEYRSMCLKHKKSHLASNTVILQKTTYICNENFKINNYYYAKVYVKSVCECLQQLLLRDSSFVLILCCCIV